MTTISIVTMTEDEGTIIDITSVRESSEWKNEFAKWLIGNKPRCGQIARVERDNGDGTMEVLASYNPRDWEVTIWAYDVESGSEQEYGILRDAYPDYNSKIAQLDDIYNERSMTYCIDVVDARGREKKLWYAFSVEEDENSEQVDLKFDNEHLVEVS